MSSRKTQAEADVALLQSPLNRLNADELRKLMEALPRETALCRLVALTCSSFAKDMKARFQMGRAKPLVTAAIFDCDGVLVDNEAAGAEAVAELLSSNGFVVTSEQVIDRYLGWSPSRLLEEVDKDDHQLPSELRQELARCRHTRCDGSQAVHGAREALLELRKEGVKLCAASVWEKAETERALRRLGLDDCFDAICGLSEEEASSSSPPGPGLYVQCAQSLSVRPEECVVIDDSAAGIEGAIAAGCKAIGFMGGSHLGDGWVDSFMLMNAGAITAASTFKDVTSLVLSQTKPLAWG